MEKDLISIIIPCFNAEKTVSRTIDSVLDQTYKNIEVILVNDGSRDSTLDLLNEYAQNNKNITVVDQVNSGVSAARNNGLQHAHGNYIMFLDSDDNYTNPMVVGEMLAKLKENDADMCVCNFTHPCFEMHIKGGVYDLTNEEDFRYYYQDFFASSMPWNKLFKREVITEPFVVGMKLGEDEIFNLDNLHNVKKVVVIDEVFHNYYCTPYVPLDQASAINGTLRDNTNSIWDLFMTNQPRREESIKKFMPDQIENMQFVRSFDFFFWVFFLMAKGRVSEEVMEDTYKSTFKKELFLESLKHKEKYGVKLKAYTYKDIETFCKLAYYSFRDIKLYNKKLSMYKVFLGIFGHFFYELTDNVDMHDMLAMTMVELRDVSTSEAVYVNSLLNLTKRNKPGNLDFLTGNMTAWFGNTSWKGDGIKER